MGLSHPTIAVPALVALELSPTASATFPPVRFPPPAGAHTARVGSEGRGAPHAAAFVRQKATPRPVVSRPTLYNCPTRFTGGTMLAYRTLLANFLPILGRIWRGQFHSPQHCMQEAVASRPEQA